MAARGNTSPGSVHPLPVLFDLIFTAEDVFASTVRRRTVAGWHDHLRPRQHKLLQITPLYCDRSAIKKVMAATAALFRCEQEITFF